MAQARGGWGAPGGGAAVSAAGPARRRVATRSFSVLARAPMAPRRSRPGRGARSSARSPPHSAATPRPIKRPLRNRPSPPLIPSASSTSFLVTIIALLLAATAARRVVATHPALRAGAQATHPALRAGAQATHPALRAGAQATHPALRAGAQATHPALRAKTQTTHP